MEFVDEKSSKYWKITLAGETTSVNNGRIGAPAGQAQDPKAHAGAAAARKHYDKMVAAKLKKGYVVAEEP